MVYHWNNRKLKTGLGKNRYIYENRYWYYMFVINNKEKYLYQYVRRIRYFMKANQKKHLHLTCIHTPIKLGGINLFNFSLNQIQNQN